MMLLVGCLYVPSSYRYQTDGTPRPESLIGQRDGIVLGKTRLADALIAIEAMKGPHFAHDPTFAGFGPIHLAWFDRAPVADDGRAVVLSYELDVGVTVYPLCLFYGEPDSRPRWLILDTDDRGVVIATHTVSEFPSKRFTGDPVGASRLNSVFDDDERRRLNEAGIVWSDEQYAQFHAVERDVNEKIRQRISEREQERRNRLDTATTKSSP